MLFCIKVTDARTGEFVGFVSSVRYASGMFYITKDQKRALMYRSLDKLHYAIDFCSRVSGGRYRFTY